MWVNRYHLLAALLLSNASAAVYAESKDAVSLEFLEFLGEFQTEEGEWIDPINLLEMEQIKSKHDDEDQTDE